MWTWTGLHFGLYLPLGGGGAIWGSYLACVFMLVVVCFPLVLYLSSCAEIQPLIPRGLACGNLWFFFLLSVRGLVSEQLLLGGQPDSGGSAPTHHVFCFRCWERVRLRKGGLRCPLGSVTVCCQRAPVECPQAFQLSPPVTVACSSLSHSARTSTSVCIWKEEKWIKEHDP